MLADVTKIFGNMNLSLDNPINNTFDDTPDK